VLTIVQPDTLIRWHRKGCLFWRWKSRAPGRPLLPPDVRHLIAAMARAKATWGEERIEGGTALTRGLCVSPRTCGATCRRVGDLAIAYRPRGGSASNIFVSDVLPAAQANHHAPGPRRVPAR
jgi:hypothetical protein